MLKKKSLYLVLFCCFAGVAVTFQNCSQSQMDYNSSSTNSAASFAEEDDIWFRLESARIKIKQLLAISDFTDKVSREVLEGQTPKSLAAALQDDVDALDDMILVQNAPTNSSDVIKKYTSLIDLLSKARDMLLAYYMHIGFDKIAKDLEEAKTKLQSSINLLASSHEALALSHKNLQNDVKEQDARMRAYRLELINEMRELEGRLTQKIEKVQADLEETIDGLNKSLLARIAQNSLELDKQNHELKSLELRVKEIEDKIKPQVEYLVRLAEQTRKDFDDFAAAFEELRQAGDATYGDTLEAWSCSEDLIDKNGQSNLNLPASVSELCAMSKEETLYSICVERYPTFCGACVGKEMDQCEHWNNPQTGLTPREKLEILINIRQEVAIEFLTQQTNLQHIAIYGSNSCRRECMELVDGQLKNSCTINDVKQCGIEGKLLALHITDQNTQAQISSLSTTIDNRISGLEDDFEKTREYSNQRFAELQTYVDSELNRLEQVMDSRFAQVASALSGLPFVSESIKDQVDQLTAESAIAEEQAAVAKALVASSLAQVPGFSHLSAHEINLLLEADIESFLKVVSEGAIGMNGAVGSLSSVMISLMRNTFEKLNADQNNIPEYNARLLQLVTGVCPANTIMQSPFANVLGRDSMEIIAIGAARRVILGDGATHVNGVKTVFADYQKSLVKGSQLQQAFFAAAFDYRRDISFSASKSCLEAIDKFALEALSGTMTTQKSGQGSIISHSLSDANVMADLLAIYEQTTLVMAKLAAMEETILSRAVANTDSLDFRNIFADMVLRLINAGTSRIIAKIKSAELSSLLLAQKEVADSSFQTQFDLAISKYISEKHKLAATINEMMGDITQLQKDMVEAEANNAKLQEQMKKLGAAVGYLQAQHRLDQLKNEKAIEDLKKQIANVTKQIEQIQEASQFNPQILAVRHSYEGLGNCTMNQLSAMAFPTSSQFVGSYLVCHVNFRQWVGDGRSANWAFGLNAIANMWFKVWGSMTDVDVQLTINSQQRSASLNFQNLDVGVKTTQGSHKVMLASGSPKSGTFMMNVPSLFSGINTSTSSFNQQVKFTPRNNITGKVGKTVTYSATFYSPLVLTFNNQGFIDTLSLEEGVDFDLMAKGQVQKTGWVQGNRGAFLVRDMNQNNRIDSGFELFGQATKSLDGKSFANGFDALAQFDSNKDGKIDSKDKVFNELKLWFDLNADGQSQMGEFKTLADMDVTEIRLDYLDVPASEQNNRGNKVLLSSTFVGPKVCGEKGCKIFDIFFNNIEVSTELAAH